MRISTEKYVENIRKELMRELLQNDWKTNSAPVGNDNEI